MAKTNEDKIYTLDKVIQKVSDFRKNHMTKSGLIANTILKKVSQTRNNG
jgi:hypothetical protein